MIRQFHEFFNLIFGGFLTFGTTVLRRAVPAARRLVGQAAAALLRHSPKQISKCYRKKRGCVNYVRIFPLRTFSFLSFILELDSVQTALIQSGSSSSLRRKLYRNC